MDMSWTRNHQSKSTMLLLELFATVSALLDTTFIFSPNQPQLWCGGSRQDIEWLPVRHLFALLFKGTLRRHLDLFHLEVGLHLIDFPRRPGHPEKSSFSELMEWMWVPIGSVCMPYMVTFTINIPQMLAYIPYMDPMGKRVIVEIKTQLASTKRTSLNYANVRNSTLKKLLDSFIPKKCQVSLASSCLGGVFSMQLAKMGKESPSKVVLAWLKIRNHNSNPVAQRNTHTHIYIYILHTHIYIYIHT